MDRLGVPLARAEFVAGVVFEAKSVTGANQVESECNINSNLDRNQQATLLELLVEYFDVFAKKNCTGAGLKPVIASAVKQINTTGSVKDRQLKETCRLTLKRVYYTEETEL